MCVFFFLFFSHHSRLGKDGEREPFRFVQHFSAISEISTARKLTHIVVIAAQGRVIVTVFVIVSRSEIELVAGVENFIVLTSNTVDPEMMAFARRDVASVEAHASNTPAAPLDGTLVTQIAVAAVEPFRRVTSRSQCHFTATLDLVRVSWTNDQNLELEVDGMAG